MPGMRIGDLITRRVKFAQPQEPWFTVGDHPRQLDIALIDDREDFVSQPLELERPQMSVAELQGHDREPQQLFLYQCIHGITFRYEL